MARGINGDEFDAGDAHLLRNCQNLPPTATGQKFNTTTPPHERPGHLAPEQPFLQSDERAKSAVAGERALRLPDTNDGIDRT